MEDPAKEYAQKKESKFKNFISNISVGQVIIFGIVVFLIISFSKNKQANPAYNYVLYGILITIILILYFKPSKEKVLLPEHIVKQIAREIVKRKVMEGHEFSFDSRVEISAACHLKYENDMVTGTSGPVAWEVGFIEHVHNSNYKKEGVIRIHPYEGICTGISFYPLGYTGRESRDRDIVPVGVVPGSIKTTDFGQPGTGGGA